MDPKPKKTPEEIREQRLQNIAKARATRMLKAKKRNAPDCHPERKQVGRTGLCHECYVGGDGAKQLSLQDALKIAEKHADPRIGAALQEQALAILLDHLPEYARLHLQAAQAAAMKGNSAPAEWALTTIRKAGEAAVVEPAQKAGAAAAGGDGPRILIAVKLGGVTDGPGASKEVTAHAVSGVLTE